MIEEKIEKYISQRDWKFGELLQLKELSKTVAKRIMDDVSSTEKLRLIWNFEVNAKTEKFGVLFNNVVEKAIQDLVMKSFQKHFEEATVKFPKEAKEESISPPLPPPPPPKEDFENEIDREKAMDKWSKVKDEGVEFDPEKDEGKVKTRAGDVNVKRVF